MSWTERLKNPRRLLWAALAVFILLHFYQLNAPPNGYHHWRESDTAAVALNYYQEDMNFLHPRVNQRGATSGITGIELPIYNYSVALLYCLTGPVHGVARLLTIFGACIGLGFFYRIVTITSGERPAAFAVWAMAFSPLFFFYSHKIMPDIWMLSLLLGAFYFHLRYLKENHRGLLAVSALLLILSACLKPLGLSIYLPLLYLTWTEKEERATRILLLAVYVLVTLSAVAGWFAYAKSVNEVHGVSAFYMGQSLPKWLDYMLTAQFFKKLFLQWPFELWVGWIFVPAFLCGLYLAFKKRVGSLYLVWALAGYIVFAIASHHASTHYYYTLIIVPPLAAISGLALHHLADSPDWRRWLAVAMVLLVPIGAAARTVHRIGPSEDYHEMRADANNSIPRDSLVMVQDQSRAIRLYQMNRKGWVLRDEINYAVVKELVEQGGRYLILDRPLAAYDDSLGLIIDTASARIGPMYCYETKK